LSSEEEQAQKMEQASREVSSRFLGCFSTEDGEFVLNRLVSITIDRPVLFGGSTKFAAGIREGQNDLVRQILQQMKIAREG
jgi:hypothetical protein